MRARRGFALMEALAALVLAMLLFGGISLYTGTWLRSWSGIVERGTREDTVAIVLDRLVEDLEAARPIFPKAGLSGDVAFEGEASEVSFVRQALGFGARGGLDEITYLNGSAGGEPAVVRARRPYPREFGSGGEDLPLMRGDARIAFAYAGADGRFADSWASAQALPEMVRVTISGSTPRPWSQTAFAMLRSRWPAACGATGAFERCLAAQAR